MENKHTENERLGISQGGATLKCSYVALKALGSKIRDSPFDNKIETTSEGGDHRVLLALLIVLKKRPLSLKSPDQNPGITAAAESFQNLKVSNYAVNGEHSFSIN